MKNLSALALSSSSNLRYLGLSLTFYDQPVEDVRELFWDYNSILQMLNISGQLAELAQLFENQPRNINNHVVESPIRITSLTLEYSLLVDDPMPVLEKFPTLRYLDLSYDSYVGKEMELPEGLIFLTSLQHLWLDSMPIDFIHKLCTTNGTQGQDYYRVAHFPHIDITQ
ncbi:hypothetical protein DCAR_0313924 [Daucus carota subsp. sativus]|uniref:Uncharacterized protein n=1 Tax=Daucus carota subsp. sativus TaxID=79200 RepID=A0AAF0WU51_DAUCS|nr:hypothetical protein DCAR_0313924 [Daucus carota subsp. sativus]